MAVEAAMNESSSRQPLWYWAIVAILVLGGAGAFWNPGQAYGTRPGFTPAEAQLSSGPSLDADFRVFREEVAQLTTEEQLKVWQSLSARTESVAEQTLYSFFALSEQDQLELLDRTIDRIEARR